MMLDDDVVAVSPSTVYRVLAGAGRLDRWNRRPSKKGTGFVQPLLPHEHWHIDVSYLNIAGTFYYLCSVLDGCSRSIVHWEIRETMTEADVECILQRARERYPQARPRIISDNGPQFIAKDFKEFIRIAGMTHVRTSPYYPQSNGKIERWHKTLKSQALRPGQPRRPRRRASRRHRVRRALQPRPPPQRHRLHHPARLPAGPLPGHLGRARPQARRGSPDAPPAPGCPTGTTECRLTTKAHDSVIILPSRRFHGEPVQRSEARRPTRHSSVRCSLCAPMPTVSGCGSIPSPMATAGRPVSGRIGVLCGTACRPSCGSNHGRGEARTPRLPHCRCEAIIRSWSRSSPISSISTSRPSPADDGWGGKGSKSGRMGPREERSMKKLLALAACLACLLSPPAAAEPPMPREDGDQQCRTTAVTTPPPGEWVRVLPGAVRSPRSEAREECLWARLKSAAASPKRAPCSRRGLCCGTPGRPGLLHPRHRDPLLPERSERRRPLRQVLDPGRLAGSHPATAYEEVWIPTGEGESRQRKELVLLEVGAGPPAGVSPGERELRTRSATRWARRADTRWATSRAEVRRV